METSRMVTIAVLVGGVAFAFFWNRRKPTSKTGKKKGGKGNTKGAKAGKTVRDDLSRARDTPTVAPQKASTPKKDTPGTRSPSGSAARAFGAEPPAEAQVRFEEALAAEPPAREAGVVVGDIDLSAVEGDTPGGTPLAAAVALEIARCMREDDGCVHLEDFGLQALPEEVAECRHVTDLYVQDNELTALPEFLGRMPSLRKLVASNNTLLFFPTSLGDTALTEIRLDNCDLDQWPEELCNVQTMENVYLCGNSVPAVPPSIVKMTALQLLDLSCNRGLRTLPAALGELTHLRVLNVADNELTALPAALAQCAQLQVLDVSDNPLGAFGVIGELRSLRRLFAANIGLKGPLDERLGQLTRLQVADLSNNRITTLPKSLRMLSQLRELHLRENRICALPWEIKYCTDLTVLAVDYNKLKVVPRDLGKCTRLETLMLVANDLSALPASLAALTKLRCLHVSQNSLEELPGEILAAMGQLEELCVDSNLLTELPAEIGMLEQLRVLDVRFNQLASLPREIVQLVYLQDLDISFNELEEIPLCIGRLESLISVRIDNNPLEGDELDLVELDTRDIVAYCEEQLAKQGDAVFQK